MSIADIINGCFFTIIQENYFYKKVELFISHTKHQKTKGRITMEIERKFLLGKLPDVTIKGIFQITQHYLAIGDESVRVRSKIDILKPEQPPVCTLTIKKGTGLVREEVDISIDQNTYHSLTKGLTTKPIEKQRNVFVYNGHTIEFDLFFGVSYAGYVLALFEVEFDSEEEAIQFIPPSFFGEEVTDNPAYLNQNIWKWLNRN